jgi:hypothetical protein
MSELLWDKLLVQIVADIETSDCSALYDLLSLLPDGIVESYLQEDLLWVQNLKYLKWE